MTQNATQTATDTARAEFARLDARKAWPEARDLALAMLAESDARLDRFVWLNNLSVALWGLRRFKAALSALNAAAKLIESAEPGNRLMGNYHNNRACALLGLGAVTAAFVEFDEAARLYELADDRARQAMVLNNVGCLYVEAGEPGRAVPYLNRAANIYDAHENHAKLAEVLRSLADAYEALSLSKA